MNTMFWIRSTFMKWVVSWLDGANPTYWPSKEDIFTHVQSEMSPHELAVWNMFVVFRRISKFISTCSKFPCRHLRHLWHLYVIHDHDIMLIYYWSNLSCLSSLRHGYSCSDSEERRERTCSTNDFFIKDALGLYKSGTWDSGYCINCPVV